MQSLREAQRIITQWENSRLSPPEEDEQELCQCGNTPEYEIDGRLYCEDCAVDELADIMGGRCEQCGELEDITYTVDDYVLCHKCFARKYRIF